LLLLLLSLTMSNHPISAYRGKSGPNSPHPHPLLDDATKSVISKQKRPKSKLFWMSSEIKSRANGCDGQNVKYGDLKTCLSQKLANDPSYHDISWDSVKSHYHHDYLSPSSQRGATSLFGGGKASPMPLQGGVPLPELSNPFQMYS
jgi:hypothetical protein